MSREIYQPPTTSHYAAWDRSRWAVPLTDNWSMRPLDEFQQGVYDQTDAGWMPAPVPGHWQHLPGLEQYAGKVVYRCHFTPPDRSEAARAWLRVNGVFYWSQPYFNGVDLGRHEGYFIPYECEVTGWLEQENTLLIEVECPNESNKYGKRMITGVFSHWDCLDPQSNPGGIWLPVELVSSGPVRLHTVRCHTETFNAHFAQLRYTAAIDTTVAGPVLLRWTIAPHTFAGPVQTIEQRRTLTSGTQQISGLLKVREPRLWWTHDLGDPDLYTITLEVLYEGVVSDSSSFTFGVRQFELRDWIPYLNGVRFLVKGNNYAPGDMRIATMTQERYAHDMQLVRDCHMNLLRVHAHVEHPTLYDVADATGVLLWQDMPLQWLYRASVLPEARRQVRAMVRLLYNHPSVVVWCMHNEPIRVADTNDETRRTRWRTYNTAIGFSWNRDVMDTQLKQVAEQEDPRRPVVRSSGEFFIPRLRAGTDTHLYFGWYSAYGSLRDAEALRLRFTPNLRFVTEFGTQSFPNVESCVKFMPADIAAIDFDHLVQRHGFQAEIMSNWLNWRTARSLHELVDMSQDYQIFINRFYIDRLRYHKYRPTGGIVPFMFCDSYPAILWSVVDYWRQPKRSYTALQMAFSPQYAFTLFEPRPYRLAEPVELPLYVVNDARQPAGNLRLRARLDAPDGTRLAVVEHALALAADCPAQEVDRLRLTPTLTGCYTLELHLTGGEREIRHAYEVEVV